MWTVISPNLVPDREVEANVHFIHYHDERGKGGVYESSLELAWSAPFNHALFSINI